MLKEGAIRYSVAVTAKREPNKPATSPLTGHLKERVAIMLLRIIMLTTKSYTPTPSNRVKGGSYQV